METALKGTAKDIETIIKLRPWLEDEARQKYKYTGNTKLVTSYDDKLQIFSFEIIFSVLLFKSIKRIAPPSGFQVVK